MQDRTKAYEPEKVVGCDSRFDPKEAFRLIVVVKKDTCPEYLRDKMDVIRVTGVGSDPAKAAEDGVWAGGEAPVEKKSAEERKREKDMVESAFEGELDEVKRMLEEGELM